MNPLAAVETQLAALDAIKLVMAHEFEDINLKPWQRQSRKLHWQLDRLLLTTATPFAWSDESVQAALAASASIPGDAVLNRWNLPESSAWWHLDTPLPWRTTDPDRPIRALNFGWFRNQFAIVCWTDPEPGMLRILPSQVWQWLDGETLDEMKARTRQEHIDRYGPGGEFAGAPQVGLETFCEATDRVSRLILAGIAWLGQKVLLADAAHVERHRRKAFDRATGQTLDGVRVVQLRKTEGPHHPHESTGHEVEWSCRWIVDGHWRNQACGAKRGDRKLIYVHPYVKGPGDKPLVAKTKVYEVSR